MEYKEAIKNLTEKFTSENGVPVKQATISIEEWNALAIKEQPNNLQQPQGEICSIHSSGHQCEYQVGWVCTSKPCILNRKLSPVDIS